MCFPGYEVILDVLTDRTHPDYTEYVVWLAEMTGIAGVCPGSLDIAALTGQWPETSASGPLMRKAPNVGVRCSCGRPLWPIRKQG